MVTIRYKAPGELVCRQCEAIGDTLRAAAVALVGKEKWELGGTVESLRWQSVKLAVPDESVRFKDRWDAGVTWRHAKIVCVSTGIPGDPVLIQPPGEIDLLN